MFKLISQKNVMPRIVTFWLHNHLWCHKKHFQKSELCQLQIKFIVLPKTGCILVRVWPAQGPLHIDYRRCSGKGPIDGITLKLFSKIFVKEWSTVKVLNQEFVNNLCDLEFRRYNYSQLLCLKCCCIWNLWVCRWGHHTWTIMPISFSVSIIIYMLTL